MTKYILASAAALALVLAPAAGMAQGAEKNGSETGKMKGPPNADGYKKSEQGAGDSKDPNGAASAKATGEDKK